MRSEQNADDPRLDATAARWRYVRPPEPRFFDQPTAAAYLGISERLFENHWRAFNLPQPRKIGRRCLWDRKLLDMWADDVSGISGSKEVRGAETNYAAEALYMSPTFPRKKGRRR